MATNTYTAVPKYNSEDHGQPLVVAYVLEDTENYQSTTLEREKRQRITACYGIGVCLCCTAFILLMFFLIPRVPVIYYESTVLDLTALPLKVVQYYEVQNRNYYSVTLSNFDQLTLVSEDIPVEIITPTSSTTVYFQFVGIGHLQNSSEILIESRQSNNFQLEYYTNATLAELYAVSAECYSSNGVSFYTSGSLQSSTYFKKNYDVPLSKLFHTCCHIYVPMLIYIWLLTW